MITFLSDMIDYVGRTYKLEPERAKKALHRIEKQLDKCLETSDQKALFKELARLNKEITEFVEGR